MSTTTISSVVADNRAAERGGAAAQSAPEGTRAVAPKRRSKAGQPAIGNINITVAEVNAALGNLVAQARTVTDAITAMMPVGLAGQVKVQGKGPSVLPFITGMAGIQTQFGAKLGTLPTDPANMQDMVGVVGATRDGVAALVGLVKVLTTLGNICLAMGFREAGFIYKQARVLAAHNQELADALAPFINAYKKPAKKAVATKRNKAKEAAQQQPAPAPVAAPATTTSTTVTSG